MNSSLLIKYLLINCSVFLSASAMNAQQPVRNEEGKPVVQDNSGHWEQAKDDSTDLSNHTNQQPATDSLNILEKKLTLALIQARINKVEIEIELSLLRAKKESVPLEQLITMEAQLREIQRVEQRFLQELEALKQVDFPTQRPLAEDEKYLPHLKNQKNGSTEFMSGLANTSGRERLILEPPDIPCSYSFHGEDANTGKVRKDVSPTTIFGFTEKSLEQFFGTHHFLVCRGNLTSLEGGIRILQLEIAITSPRAVQMFGSFQKGEFIEIQLLDGQTIRFINSLPDSGQWQPERQAVVYEGQYAIGGREEKLLRNIELDRIKIRWSKVEETFEVYELDFFIRQFHCLDGK